MQPLRICPAGPHCDLVRRTGVTRYLSPMYVRLDGKEYHQDTTADLIDGVNISSAGGLDPDQTSRTFAAAIKIKTSLVSTIDIKLTCEPAPPPSLTHTHPQ